MNSDVLDKDVFWAVFLIHCPEDYEDAVFAVVSSMITVDDRLRRWQPEGSRGWIVLEKLFRKEPPDEELYAFAATLSDTISAEAMCRALIGFDRAGGGLETSMDITNAMTAVRIGLRYKLKSPILPYYDLGLAKLVYSLPEDAAREYIQDNLGNFRFSDLDTETLNTIYTFFDTGLSLAKTAKQLFIHRNTLNYRIDKFQRLSGLNLRKFDDAVVCQIAMLIGEL